MKRKACLTCRYVSFHQAADWTPDYDGDQYGTHDVIQTLRKTGRHEPVTCTFNPQWVAFTTEHYCGRWRGGSDSHDLQEVIWGTWQSKRIEALRRDVERLRGQLTAARRISSSRLERLKRGKTNGIVSTKMEDTP